MSELWELICHHTYGGIPGVVFDLSGTDASHGSAVGLADGDFLADGATAGSGAVRCYNPLGRVHVSAAARPWRTLGGVKGEITFKREAPGLNSISFLVDSDAFQFFIRSENLVAWFSSYPVQYAELSTHNDAVGSQYFVPLGRWVTLGFMHDGFGTMEIYADGAVVARRNSALAPVTSPGPSGLSIGNSGAPGSPLKGQIDELKIWRLNPRRFDEAFNGRPMDDQTADCWVRLRREFIEALRRHPECAGKLGPAIDNALRSLLRQAAAQGPETQARLAAASRAYGELWSAGKVGGPEMVKVFTDLFAWFQLVGIPIETNQMAAQLADSDCLRKIMAEITPPDCDRQLMDLMRAFGEASGLPGTPPRSAG